MGYVKQLALGAAGALAAAATPAYALLQVTLDVNGINFTCVDGAACDKDSSSGELNFNKTIDGVKFTGTFAASQTNPNILETTSEKINNTSGSSVTFEVVVGQTDFLAPVSQVAVSGAGTWTKGAGSTATLEWWADTANSQGANPLNTPGAMVGTTSTTASAFPNSFSYNNSASWNATGNFSMTENISGTLKAGADLTGYEQTQLAVPEPATWAMMALGFAGLGYAGFRRSAKARFASF